MEKQIETVYVPTDEAPYFIVKDVEKEFIKARVTEQQAYLYTPKEHAAVQGYRLNLERVIDMARDYNDGWVHSIDDIQQALSKAEDKGEAERMKYYQTARETFSNAVSNLDIQTRTACDSFILAFDHLLNHVSDIHVGNIPTNSLDELERWVEQRSESSDSVSHMVLLAKIQELKTITTNNGWISVEDRLPEEQYQNYLVIVEDLITVAYWKGTYWDCEYPVNQATVTHWQPLPPKP